jgi:hypothetical protein
MSNITINPQSKSDNSNFNPSALKQSTFFKNSYSELIDNIKGSLTQAYQDVDNIFLIANKDFTPTDLQLCTLAKFRDVFCQISEAIDPLRNNFTITKAMDDEICINRKTTSEGRAKIIIHEDGTFALSFLPYSGNPAPSFLEFYRIDNADIESLSYSFFGF